MRCDEHDLLNRLKRLTRPESSYGLELCKLGLMDAVWGSQIERRIWSLRYCHEGKLRLIADIAHRQLHGEFLLFYPDGRLWVKGAYRENRLIETAMKIFMPDKTQPKREPPPDNIIPFPKSFGGN